VLADVVDEDVADDLLGAHGRGFRQDGAALGELIVREPPDDGRRRGGALLVQGDRIGPGAVGLLLGVLGVCLVEHVHREVRHRLARGDGLHDHRDLLVRARHVVGGHPDRPLLRLRHLLPVGVAHLLQHRRRFLRPGLELLRQPLGLRSHGILLDRQMGRLQTTPGPWDVQGRCLDSGGHFVAKQ
jgi:hypothetical protein